ncbi:MAG: hypothetical protein P8I76_04715 [Woeseiaceae bacterium]|nr:hypothetical protein [Woeseiaceae bacterium]
MKQEISTKWFTIATNLGVIVGLISVIFQMIEDRNLLKVTLTNDYYHSYINADTLFAGENLPAVYEKALLNPKDLSISEMRIMEAQTFSPINRWINLYRMAEAGIVDDTFWKSQIDLDTTYYLGTPYASPWWEISSPLSSSDFLPDEVRERIEINLYNDNGKPKTSYTKNYYEKIKNAIKED